jgi:hypothetical protein
MQNEKFKIQNVGAGRALRWCISGWTRLRWEASAVAQKLWRDESARQGVQNGRDNPARGIELRTRRESRVKKFGGAPGNSGLRRWRKAVSSDVVVSCLVSVACIFFSRFFTRFSPVFQAQVAWFSRVVEKEGQNKLKMQNSKCKMPELHGPAWRDGYARSAELGNIEVLAHGQYSEWGRGKS